MRVTRTFAFLDLSGFTAYNALRGDQQSTLVLSQLRSAVRTATERRGVRLAKWLGDGAMLSGLEPQNVVACSLEAQYVLREVEKCPLHLRAGICQGKVIMFEGDDYLGVAVNQASKLCDEAQQGEVLVAGISRSDLPGWAYPVHRRFLDPAQLGPQVEVVELSMPAEDIRGAEKDPVCGLPLLREHLAHTDPEAPLFCSPECRAAWMIEQSENGL